MSHTLSESGAAFPTPITVPDPGDDANADDLELILQALVDRDAYLKALAETSGVKMLRTVAGTSALKAIDTSSGMTDGELRYLAGTDFNGLYKYVAGSVLAEALPWVVAPTTGSGRWIHELYSLAAANLGLATLTSGGRVVQKPANAIIDVQSVYSIGYSNATGSYTNVLSLSHTGEVGDIVLIDWHAAFTTVGSGGSYSRISITDGGVETDIAATRATHSAVREHHGGAYKHTVGSAGAIVVRLKAVSISSGTTADDAGGAVTCVPSMKSVLIRP